MLPFIADWAQYCLDGCKNVHLMDGDQIGEMDAVFAEPLPDSTFIIMGFGKHFPHHVLSRNPKHIQAHIMRQKVLMFEAGTGKEAVDSMLAVLAMSLDRHFRTRRAENVSRSLCSCCCDGGEVEAELPSLSMRSIQMIQHMSRWRAR